MSATKWDDSFDVVVAGSGVAGLATALAAAALGLEVAVLEKAQLLGGSTALANTLWVGNNHLARKAGIEDDREDVLRYMRFVGGDQIRDENLLAFVDAAPNSLKFFEDCGVRWRLMSTIVDHYYPAVPGSIGVGRSVEAELISENELGELVGTVRVKPDESTHVTQDEVYAAGGHQNPKGWDSALIEERRANRIRGRGAALVIHMLKGLQARGVTIERGVGVNELVVIDGRVAGVETSDGRRIGARRGVALTTGGYESNAALMARFENLPGCRSMFVESSVGDGLALGSAVGGGVSIIQNNMAVLLGFDVPESDGKAPTFRLAGILELLAPHTMVVNRWGRRFADESYFQNVAARLRDFDVATHQPANWPCYLIFDQQFVDKFSFAGAASGAQVPAWVARSETVAGLASALEVDAAGLESTVEQFNTYAASGLDTDFGRPSYEWSVSQRESFWGEYVNPSLGSIAEPPFYGIRLYTAPFSSAGLSIDDNAQVTDLNDKPIPGLYSAGNAAAHTEYGIGYQAGYSLASGLTFGYLAARHMAGGRDQPLGHESTSEIVAPSASR